MTDTDPFYSVLFLLVIDHQYICRVFYDGFGDLTFENRILRKDGVLTRIESNMVIRTQTCTMC